MVLLVFLGPGAAKSNTAAAQKRYSPFRPENPETDWDDKPRFPRLVIPVRVCLVLFGWKTPKRTGMTSPGFPGLSSQSVSGFWALFGQKTPKRTGMTSLGFPGLSSQSVSDFLCLFCGQQNPKRTGMSSLGFPGLSSQSVSGFFGPSRPENPKTDWDDKPGVPRLVIPVGFGFFGFSSARKSPKRTSLGIPGLSSSQSVSGFLGPFSARKP